MMPLWCFVQHTASPGSFGFEIAALALITLGRKKGKKKNICLLKLSNSPTIITVIKKLYYTVVFEIAKVAGYIPKQVVITLAVTEKSCRP